MQFHFIPANIAGLIRWRLSIVLSHFRAFSRQSVDFLYELNKTCVANDTFIYDYIDFYLFYYFSRNQQEEND